MVERKTYRLVFFAHKRRRRKWPRGTDAFRCFRKRYGLPLFFSSRLLLRSPPFPPLISLSLSRFEFVYIEPTATLDARVGWRRQRRCRPIATTKDLPTASNREEEPLDQKRCSLYFSNRFSRSARLLVFALLNYRPFLPSFVLLPPFFDSIFPIRSKKQRQECDRVSTWLTLLLFLSLFLSFSLSYSRSTWSTRHEKKKKKRSFRIPQNFNLPLSFDSTIDKNESRLWINKKTFAHFTYGRFSAHGKKSRSTFFRSRSAYSSKSVEGG